MFSWVLASTKSPIILEEIWVKTSFVIYLLEKKIRKKAKIEKKTMIIVKIIDRTKIVRTIKENIICCLICQFRIQPSILLTTLWL